MTKSNKLLATIGCGLSLIAASLGGLTACGEAPDRVTQADSYNMYAIVKEIDGTLKVHKITDSRTHFFSFCGMDGHCDYKDEIWINYPDGKRNFHVEMAFLPPSHEDWARLQDKVEYCPDCFPEKTNNK